MIYVDCGSRARQLYQTVSAAYAQFEDNKPFAVIVVEESIGLLALVLHRAVMQHILESAFHLEHLAGCEAGQFQMSVGIGGKNEVVLIAGYGKQVFHHL